MVSLAIEVLEDRQQLDTLRRDDQVQFVEEPLFEREGEAWATTPYARQVCVPGRFAVDKGDRWRLFALGGSFLMGAPYAHQDHAQEQPGGMLSFLRAGLAGLAPDAEIEIVNLGASGQDSHRVLRIAEQVLPHDPDALLVATCNNEGTLAPSRLRELLHQQGGYRLLTKLLADPAGSEGRGLYTLQDPDDQALAAQFRGNLRAIIDLSEAQGVPLFLATLPQNLRYQGLQQGHDRAAGGAHPAGEDPCVGPGRSLVQQGRAADALELLASCDHAADALRWIGLAELQLGRVEAAEQHLVQALELAPRNRCRSSFEDIIREEAAGRELVILVDLQGYAEELSPDGIPGDELFLDYCHMNWQGYGAMASELARAILASGYGPPGIAADAAWPSHYGLAGQLGLDWNARVPSAFPGAVEQASPPAPPTQAPPPPGAPAPNLR